MVFNGQRLKIARIYRNMSITELAEKIGVKKQSISQFENGISRPKPDTEFSIMTILNFPRDFFYQETYALDVNNTFFRALSSASALDKKTQEYKAQMVVQIYNFLCEYLELPRLNIPSFDYEKSTIEEIALALRNHWHIGEMPIPNMINLLENNGIIVSAFDVDSDKIDAFTQVHSFGSMSQYCIVVGNNKTSAVRRNFDMAHELGHIVLHSGVENLDELNSEQLRTMEDEANQFAAAFLLPRNAFYEELKFPNELLEYIELKKKWNVSISAMLIRAKSLGRISTKDYQSLMKSMSYRKWRILEPLDDTLKLSVPTLFSSALEVLFESNIMTPKTFIAKLAQYGLSMKAEELEKLLALPSNTLNTTLNSIPDIKPIITIK